MCHQSFKKIRIQGVKNKDIHELFNKRRTLRAKEDDLSKTELKKVEEELVNKCAEQNYHKIRSEVENIQCDEGGFNAGKLWSLKESYALGLKTL